MGPLLFFLVIAALVITVVVKDRERVNAAWQAAAGELGIRYNAGSFFSRPTLVGPIGDVQVEVSVYASSGENSSNYTRYLVRHHPVGPPVTLRKQGALSFVRRLFGGKDVLIGDPLFDGRVIIDSNSAAAVRDFLTPERRAAILDLLSLHPSGEITHDAIRIDVLKICRDHRELVSRVRWLVAMASVMGDTRLSQILEHQQHGDLVRAAQELHDLNQERPNVFTQTLEGAALAEAGRHEDAAAVLDDVWTGQMGDPAVDGWHDLSHLPSPPAVLDAPAEQPGTIAVPADVRQDVVADDLFSSERMSWEVVDYFEQTYRNATVEWSGAVTRVSKYQRDLDFGVGPGIKATVLIGHAGVSDVISNEVHAVVQLPPDAGLATGSGLRTGDQIRFRGLLTNVDRFSRKVWVQHADLI